MAEQWPAHKHSLADRQLPKCLVLKNQPGTDYSDILFDWRCWRSYLPRDWIERRHVVAAATFRWQANIRHCVGVVPPSDQALLGHVFDLFA